MLRHSVAIQARTETRTASGAFTVSWTTVTTRKVAINSEAGRKFYAAMQSESERSLTVVMRYYEGLTTKGHRLLFGSRAFNIERIATVDEIEHWMVLLCREDAG